MKNHKNPWKILLLFALCIFLISNSFFTVNENETAVILTFGNPVKAVGSGPQFKIPFIQSHKKVSTTVKGFAIGYDEETNASTSESSMITKDFNIINVDFFVEWRVSDPIKALYNSQSPVAILKNVVQSAARSVIGTKSVDEVLTVGKEEIQVSIKEIARNKLDELDLGIQVQNISIQDAEPPTHDVISAFKAVEDAMQNKDSQINDANAYRNREIPAARAESNKILREAEAESQSRINAANGQVVRFNEMYKEYIKNPNITKKRMFFEAMEEILPGMEVIIEGADGTQKVYPIKPLNGGN